MTSHCWFCSGPPESAPRDAHGYVRSALTEDMLCAPHWAEEMAAVAEIRADHPEGRCTDTCGCMSLEQFEARLAL